MNQFLIKYFLAVLLNAQVCGGQEGVLVRAWGGEGSGGGRDSGMVLEHEQIRPWG